MRGKMKIFCGTDIIEIDRIRDSIEEWGEKFLKKVYTKKEIEYCEKRKKVKYQHYAARFAAKEAVFKALSSLLKNKMDLLWENIEILKNEQGRPYVHLINIEIEEISQIDISLSHCEKYAVANVVVIVEN